MLGAIIGDIIGSKYEFNNHRSKDFVLFAEDCFFTDDTVMTLAIAKAIQESDGDPGSLEQNVIRCMQEIGRPYPHCGYGGRFHGWIYSDDPRPYNSFGNGAAMRISACVDAVRGVEKEDYDLLMHRVHVVTGVTHNHPEGLKGAEAVALAALMARIGKTIPEIKAFIDEHYCRVDFTLDEIRDTYEFNETCQDTVPQALAAFYESTSFEDAMRNAISVGGDSDTLAAITGTIAEHYYGIPAWMQQAALSYLDDRLLDLYEGFQEYLGVSYVDPASLESGKVLHSLKLRFLEEPSPLRMDALLSCLRDSIVKVPGKGVMSDRDKKRFLEAMKAGEGASFYNEDGIVFEPDIIMDGEGSQFFPLFSNEEQIPEEYKQHFTIRDMYATRCIEMAKSRGELAGLVLDPFTEPVPIHMDLADVVNRKPSRVRIRDDHRVMNEEMSIILEGMPEELDALEEAAKE